jgi:hypothetical protein
MNNYNVLSAIVVSVALSFSPPLLAAEGDAVAKKIIEAELAHMAAQMRQEIEQVAHTELETGIGKPEVTMDAIDSGIPSPPAAAESDQLSAR